MHSILIEKQYTVRCFGRPTLALESLKSDCPDLILIDVRMPEMDGLEVCRRLKADKTTAEIPILFLSAANELEGIIRAFDMGASDFIAKPFHTDEVAARVKTHLELYKVRRQLSQLSQSLESRIEEQTSELLKANEELAELKRRIEAENIMLSEELSRRNQVGDIVGESDEIKYVLHRISQVAPTNSSVLILGETGTGKELIARAIHKQSSRAKMPMIKVDCTSLPEQLIDSELFGHEKGAFTGAVKNRVGRFEFANNGTLFLDEIGELPLILQSKLLRVIQDGEFERIGSNRIIKTDVRLIAATNRDLEQMVNDGLFRADLWYRLNVFRITSPPLRSRKNDILPLVQHFIAKNEKKVGRKFNSVSKSYLDGMMSYNWPGNVRELEHNIERAMITSSENQLNSDESFIKEVKPINSANVSLASVQREHIIKVLKENNWVIDGPHGAAKVLECHPNTLRYRMKKLKIHRPQ